MINEAKEKAFEDRFENVSEEEFENNIIELYLLTDEKVIDIADAAKITPRRMYKILDKHKIPRRNKKNTLTPSQIESLLDSFYKGNSIYELSNQYNISINMILDVIEKYN